MSNENDLKEFLYVDVDRTRSLLAQLEGGVAETVKSISDHTIEAGAQALPLGVGGRGGYAQKTSREESRSLQDLTFVAFEQLANESAIITELGRDFRDPSRWESGNIHGLLQEGELVRIDCDVQVLDGKLFGDRVRRFAEMADAVVKLSGDVTPPGANPKQRAQALAAAKTVIMGGTDEAQLTAMSDFVGAFVGEGISLRVLCCGGEHLEYGFSGALLGRREYIQEERENLFSRYGTVASNWTSVLQIAAIPSADTGDASAVEPDTVRATGEINRAAMERVAGQLLGMMEAIGIVEGPRWPTISVTPLAVYRTVPKGYVT